MLLDICLKGPQDGISVARAIRDQYGIPVVFLSAFFDKDTLQRASQVEPYGYLTKPFDERDLHATLQMALAKSQADRDLQQRFEDLMAVLDTQLQGTVLLDAAGCVTFMNQAAQRMLGIDPAVALLRPWSEALPFSSEQKVEIEKACLLPAADRCKIQAPSPSPPPHASSLKASKPPALEINVQDDPRDPSRKILFLVDVSQLHSLRRLLDGETSFENIIGSSEPMQEVYQLIRDFARVDSSVLIEGETGSGKELVARAIHNLSDRHCRAVCRHQLRWTERRTRRQPALWPPSRGVYRRRQ